MSKKQLWDELFEREATARHEPWANPQGPRVHARIQSDIRPRTGGAGLVLVVDDDPLVLAMTERTLRRYGFEIITASDGPTAIEIYREEGEQIDLVVLDVTMPDMDGIDTCVELYKLDAKLRVIFASGYDAGAADAEELPDCVKGFVQKPYRPSDLAALMNGIIEDEPPTD